MIRLDARVEREIMSRNRPGVSAKHFHHHAVGDLTLAYENVDLTAEPGLGLVIYAAEPGCPSEDGLRVLAAWAASLPTAGHDVGPSMPQGRRPSAPASSGRQVTGGRSHRLRSSFKRMTLASTGRTVGRSGL